MTPAADGGPVGRRGFHVLADLLVDAGVTDLFAVMGEGNLELIAHLAGDRGVAHHAFRHENGAVAAAHGYAQASGRLGVATVTHGPGFTNALTALVSATRLAAPVLLVVGDVAGAGDGHVQALDHAAVARAAGATVEVARAPEALGVVAARAVRTARHERRAVVLLVPVDVQELPAAPDPAPPVVEPPAPARVAADPAAVAAAVDVLRAARHPLVLAGRGAHVSGAAPDLVTLAQRTGAWLATSLLAKGMFHGRPGDLGVAGGYARPAARTALARADAVVAVGAGLNAFTTVGGTLFADATIVHVDADPAAPGRWTPAHLALVGDARTVARQLLDGLHGNTPRPAPDVPSEAPAGALGAPPLDADTVCRALDSVLPSDRTLVVDGGHFTGAPCAWVDVPDPDGMVFSLGFGSVGLGLGAAVGAAVARPDRPCIAVVGDGGAMMSLGELDTAVRVGARLVLVVLDDGAYGAEVHHLRARGHDDASARFATPDLVAVARALGADALALDGPEDVAEVGRRVAGGLEGPLLVHVRIRGDTPSPWFAGLVEHGARFVRRR